MIRDSLETGFINSSFNNDYVAKLVLTLSSHVRLLIKS